MIHHTNKENFQKLESKSYEVKLVSCNAQNFKEQLLDAMIQSNNYLLFACNGMIFTHYLDCSQAIYELEKKFAYGFFMDSGRMPQSRIRMASRNQCRRLIKLLHQSMDGHSITLIQGIVPSSILFLQHCIEKNIRANKRSFIY